MIALDRKALLVRTGLALAAAGFADLEDVAAAPEAERELTWDDVRRLFRLAPGWIHMSGLLLASHPAPVRRAIERHRRGLDANAVHYLHDRGPELEAAVLRAAGAYLRARPVDIALTDSTTMGLGLLYNGIDLGAGQEVLTTTHDFFASHESVRLKAARVGASVRHVRLYRDARRATEDEIVSTLVGAVGARTRVIALTWVHSSTGVKLPLARISRALGDRRREVFLCVDGVHGLGVEQPGVASLGCDFFVAGCHKWLFGPRGTGILWGRRGAWGSVGPTIPSFSGTGSFGAEMTPGGFHSFEHRWALAEAFRLQLRIGKSRVARRVHALNRRLKVGLASMPHVRLLTPQSDALSAGVVCFAVDRMSPGAVVDALRRRRIIATVTPYDPPYARLAPGLLNTPAEVDRALRAIHALR